MSAFSLRNAAPVLEGSQAAVALALNPAEYGSETRSMEDFRQIALMALESICFFVRVAREKMGVAEKEKFKKKEPMAHRKNLSASVAYEKLKSYITKTFDVPEEQWAIEAQKVALPCLDAIYNGTSAREIYKELQKAHNMHIKALVDMRADDWARITLNPVVVEPTDKIKPPTEKKTFSYYSTEDEITVIWRRSLGDDFYSAVVNSAEQLRSVKAQPGFRTFLTCHFAYHDVAAGRLVVKGGPKFLGTVGFRAHAQTYASLTDPGDGHIFGTSRKTEWMNGSIVHNEYLERPGGLPRREIESYRMPSIINFSCVRLHVGTHAPMTLYVGRFPYSSTSRNFQNDFKTAIHTTSAALAAFFAAGAAECKISMEGLTTKQMLAYMSALATTARSRLQYLSAAFNTNPIDGYILDDAGDEEDPNGNHVVTKLMKPFNILRRGIELAALGGFDKVTFDGAGDDYPSIPLTEQVPFPQILELVHEAHSVGLTTYLSAGFKFDNLKDAVLTGVDGIGLGGTQILRSKDDTTGYHGNFWEQNIVLIQKERDGAEKLSRGKGALLLARLDQMHFEGSSTDEEEALRLEIYPILRNFDPSPKPPAEATAQQKAKVAELTAQVEAVLQKPVAKAILELQHDGDTPFVGRARRILRTESPRLRRGAENEEQWTKFKQMLEKLVASEKDEALYEKYKDAPGVWFAIRKRYRESTVLAKVTRALPATQCSRSPSRRMPLVVEIEGSVPAKPLVLSSNTS